MAWFIGTSRPASYYLDATLRAIKPVTVFRYPNGPEIRKVAAGSIVGEIYSWVNRDNGLWWLLKEGGAVQHAPQTFDARLAEYSGKGKQWELIEATETTIPGEVATGVGNLFTVLKWGLIAFLGLSLWKVYETAKR